MATCLFSGTVRFFSVVLFLIFTSGQAGAENGQPIQYAQPAQPVLTTQPAEPKYKAASQSRKMPGLAYEKDTECFDLTSFGGKGVHFGVLDASTLEPVRDKEYENGLLIQLLAAARGLRAQDAGLQSYDLELAPDYNILYKKRAILPRFYYYVTNGAGQESDGRSFTSDAQATIAGRLKTNIREAVARTNWRPPNYDALGVPPPTKATKSEYVPLKPLESLEKFVSGFETLQRLLAQIDKVDAKLADRLAKLIKKGKVLRVNRVNLDGATEPTNIYQIVRWTPEAIRVAEGSFSLQTEPSQSKGMLFALLSGLLPTNPLAHNRAYQFHLDIIALTRDGGDIDPAKYEEAKRVFSRSPRTGELYAMVDEVDSYHASLIEKNRLHPEYDADTLDQLRLLKQFLEITAFYAMSRDYSEGFGDQIRAFPNSTESKLAPWVQYRLCKVIAKMVLSEKTTTAAAEEEVESLSHLIKAVAAGDITGKELETWVTEKEKAVKAGKAGQPVAPPPPVR